MNDYFAVGICTIIFPSLLVVFVQWKFGKGVLTRLFRVVILCISITGYVAFVLGRGGITLITLPTSVTIVVATVIGMVFLIHKTIVIRIQTQADSVSGIIKRLTATSNESSASAEEQASAATQVSSAVDEIHQMSKITAETSQNMAGVTGEALAQGKDGLDLVRELHRIMEKFASAKDFVDIVNQVAEQSNLLAFNAGIEAAKAADYGRGFSVVASEVRNLADQSKGAARRIRETISTSERGQRAAASTNEVITRLATVLQDASEKALKISGASVQQSAGIKQIAEAMDNLVQSGRHTATTSMQIKLAAEELNQVSSELLNFLHGQSLTNNNRLRTA